MPMVIPILGRPTLLQGGETTGGTSPIRQMGYLSH